jgi:hypothetical protein
MITTKLQWWLWNQMFQFAIWKSLSLKYNTNLVIDDTFNKNRFPQKNLTYRDYELNVFWIENELNKISKIFNKITFLNKIIHPYIINTINKIYNWKRYIKENNWKYIKYISDNVYLDWFWQTSNYFKDYEEEIKEIFEVKTEINWNNKEILDLINKNYSNTVSIHIRRWDYITNSQANSWHGTCDTNYYLKAIKHIKDNIKEPYFIIFSDDIEWVKDNMDFWNNSLFVEGNDWKWHEDLRLMYSCANHIIANSSFSWWWAYLWKNKNKIIIAPYKWLNNENYDTSNIIPNKWIKI